MANQKSRLFRQGNTFEGFKRAGFLPIPLFAILLTALSLLDSQQVYSAPLLLTALNLSLGVMAGLLVATLALHIYDNHGASAYLFLGCGSLSLALGYLASSALIHIEAGPNAAVTIQDTTHLLSALCHVLVFLVIYAGSLPEPELKGRRRKAILSYTSIAAFTILIAVFSLKDLGPTFFIQGDSSTLIEQFVLSTAIILYVVAAILFISLYARSQIHFVYWYALALILIAVGLVAILLQTAIDTPINWLGRSAGYLGHIYFLITLFVARCEFREQGLKLEQGMANVLRHRLELLIEERTLKLQSANQKLEEEIQQRQEVEAMLRKKNLLLSTLSQAQSQFITNVELSILFDKMLETLLELTGSEYGFIGEVFQREDAPPFLKTHALTNIAWDEETERLYATYAATGMVFEKLDNLFGHVIVHGEVVIANTPGSDPRRGGLPPGHPPLNTFLGLPFYYGSKLVGMAGVANRAGDYDAQLVADLEPFLSTCASIIEAHATERRRQKAETELAASLAAEREQRNLAETLQEVTLALTAQTDYTAVLAQILRQTQRIVPATTANIALLQNDELAIVYRQQHDENIDDGDFHIHYLQPTRGFPLDIEVLQNQQPLATPDTLQEERWVVQPKSAWIRSHLAVPICLRGRAIGLLRLDGDTPGQFSNEDGQRLQPLANAAAIALENARLFQQARQDAETRAVLLEEVNHRVSNNLTAIMGLLAIERRHPNVADNEVFQAIIDDLHHRIQGLATVHRLLSAAEWAPIPLSELCTQIVLGARQIVPSGKQLNMSVPHHDLLISPSQASHLALVINELVTNVAKYAFANRPEAQVSIKISLEKGCTKIIFEDDGPGFSEEVLTNKKHHVGLSLIESIVRHNLRGQLYLENRQGATAIIEFPANNE